MTTETTNDIIYAETNYHTICRFYGIDPEEWASEENFPVTVARHSDGHWGVDGDGGHLTDEEWAPRDDAQGYALIDAIGDWE